MYYCRYFRVMAAKDCFRQTGVSSICLCRCVLRWPHDIIGTLSTMRFLSHIARLSNEVRGPWRLDANSPEMKSSGPCLIVAHWCGAPFVVALTVALCILEVFVGGFLVQGKQHGVIESPRARCSISAAWSVSIPTKCTSWKQTVYRLHDAATDMRESGKLTNYVGKNSPRQE